MTSPRRGTGPAGPQAPSSLHVCHVIHRLQDGGAEQLLVDLATAGGGAGLRTSVVSLTGTAGTRNGRALAAAGADVHALGLSSRWDPRALSRGLTTIRALGPDVIHTHLKHADLVGAFAARRLALPMVSTLHVIEDAPTRIARVKRWLAAQSRRRVARCTITVSEAQRRWYLAAFPRSRGPVRTVRNGVLPAPPIDPGRRTQLRSELGAAADDVLVVMVSILRRGKGHEDLLAAVAQVPPAARVVVAVVGDGEERARIDALLGESGLQGRVHLVGYRDDVPELLQAADLIVQPSQFDALPTTLIRGLAAGVPGIAYAVGGIPEILTSDVGVLVPPGRPDQLAQAITDLAQDPARRSALALAARRRFENEFSADVWVRRLLDVYEGVRA